MKNKLCFFVLLGCAIQMGCSSPSSSVSNNQKYSPVYSPLSKPKLNEQATTYLGDVMLRQVVGVTTKAIEVGGAEGATTSVPAGVFYNAGGDIYRAEGDIKVGIKNGFGQVKWYRDYVSYDGSQLCANDSLSCYTKQEVSLKEIPEYFYTKPDSFQQVIEYNGKSGDTLNFTYREFANNMARSAYTTNFTMDMSEGDELNYKGAVLKIIRVDNKSISYSVLKNFNSLDGR